MLTRRQLLLDGSALALAGRPNPRPLGLILKMKDDLARDYEGTLARVGSLGYRELEFPGFVGPSARACRATLDRLGLRAFAGGDVYRNLDKNLPEVLETSQVLGKRYVCCYWPWLDGGTNKTPDDWKRLGDTMNALGARVRAGGLRLAYHNHDMEFRPSAPDAPLPYELLLGSTDPALVTMELDLWWLHKAGVAAPPLLARYPGRFEILHVKEPRNTPETGMACDGRSFVALRETLRAASRAGVKHVVCENEDPADHYGCAARTARVLRRHW